MRFRVSDGLPPSLRLWTPRLVATLALFVVSATFFCAIAGSILVRQADDRQAFERRAALLGAIEDARQSGIDFRRLDARVVKSLERTAGLKDLRFESEPVSDGRVVQSVLDRNGRIVGWFSWQPDHSMSDALRQLRPLLAVTGVMLVGFAAIALWQVRRALHRLGKSERLAWQLAHEDMLTSLPNHRKMVDHIDALLAARGLQDTVTLALLDLDGLADINAAHGHRAGDDVLVALAARVRGATPARAICGRFDGDQFILVITAQDIGAAEIAVADFAAHLAQPFWLNDHAVQLGVTLGVAHAPHDAQSRDELMRRADLALRSAKRTQRGGARHFEPAMEAEFEERRFLERELRRALDDQALDVHYQPIVSADGNRVVGAEALVRWDHPARGPVAPSAFVPLAEQSGLMPRLGYFVLCRALSDAARWPDLPVAVNISPMQIRDPKLVDLIASLLAEHNIPAERLTLEITEGVLVDDPDQAKARLDGLKALGVKLALDDFGTGYSSLTYLQRFSFDKLKIDKGFVDPLGQSADSHAVVHAIVALGRALGLTLLAEGVETEEQRVLLRMAGCQEMQGFLFAPPASREALDRLLAETKAVA